jgi:hypothetical protein
MVFAARALVDAERRDEADRVVDELALRERPEILLIAGTSVDVPSVLLELNRAEELVAATERLASTTLWLDAALAYVGRDFVGGADVYARIGSLPDEAYARLRAAEHLVGAGRRAEADIQLQTSLGFWRSVSATRYVREGGTLLAASA